MTSLLSVLGPITPEIEEVIAKQGHKNRIYIAHIKGSPKVYVSDRNLRFQRPIKGYTVLTLTLNYINNSLKKLTPVHAFFDVGTIFFIGMRHFLTSARSPDDGVICGSLILHQKISIHWGDSAQFNLAPRLQFETLFANCAVKRKCTIINPRHLRKKSLKQAITDNFKQYD